MIFIITINSRSQTVLRELLRPPPNCAQSKSHPVCMYSCIVIYTPFPYPKLCPYPKPTQQQTPVETPKDPTNQIAAYNLRAPIRPRPAGPRANTKLKWE